MANYQLTVKNDSYNSGDICVYQTVPYQDRNLFSLVWFNKSCHPGTTVRFRWTDDYSFCWADTGELRPGVVFEACEMKETAPADPQKNSIGFSKRDGAYLFTPTNQRSPNDCLGISVDESVSIYEAAVGVGVGGHAAFAIDALPNYRISFSARPQYWVAFGNFREGEVLDLNSIRGAYNVRFNANEQNKTITLNEDNTWSDD